MKTALFAINSISAIVTVKDRTMLEATAAQVFVNVDGTRLSDTEEVVITIQPDAIRLSLFLELPSSKEPITLATTSLRSGFKVLTY